MSLTNEMAVLFVQKFIFILMKMHKNMPPELLLLAQICSKSFVGWGFAPESRPHWGSLQRSPDPLAGLAGGVPGKGKEGGEAKGGAGGGRG